MAEENVAVIDLGIANADKGTLEERVGFLEVLKKLDQEPSSFEERYPIQIDIEKELCRVDNEIRSCQDEDRVYELHERSHDLHQQLEKVKNI